MHPVNALPSLFQNALMSMFLPAQKQSESANTSCIEHLHAVRVSGLPVCKGNMRLIMQNAFDAVTAGVPATLAIILETEGSTYAGVNSMALFTPSKTTGWLSGGCLEPDIQQTALNAAMHSHIDWMEIDTRDDGSLLAGSATGCRGRLRIALLPLHPLSGCSDLFAAWLADDQALTLTISTDGTVKMSIASHPARWSINAQPLPWSASSNTWQCVIQRSPSVLLLGTGPEAQVLIRLLHDLGWKITCAERRKRWQQPAYRQEQTLTLSPDEAIALHSGNDAALVMHHNFEMDYEALHALADLPIGFIGLLGPKRRRDDLLQLLATPKRNALLTRLHAPIGLNLGGHGPEAIALSVAAELEAWRNTGSVGIPG